METNEFKSNLAAIREKLPQGWIKEITGDNPGQKARLRAMFEKDSVESMTPGECEMLKKFLDYGKKYQAATAELNSEVAKLAGKIK